MGGDYDAALAYNDPETDYINKRFNIVRVRETDLFYKVTLGFAYRRVCPRAFIQCSLMVSFVTAELTDAQNMVDCKFYTAYIYINLYKNGSVQ